MTECACCGDDLPIKDARVVETEDEGEQAIEYWCQSCCESFESRLENSL